MRHETDAIVIGGPVGLFAVFELGMVRLKCHVVDALPAIGGQLTARSGEAHLRHTRLSAHPGHQRLSALLEQASPFRPRFHLEVTVELLLRLPDGRWEVALSDGQALLAPVVVVAAGAGAFGPNRPPLDGLGRYEGKSVFYLVKSGRLRDKRNRHRRRRRFGGRLGDFPRRHRARSWSSIAAPSSAPRRMGCAGSNALAAAGRSTW